MSKQGKIVVAEIEVGYSHAEPCNHAWRLKDGDTVRLYDPCPVCAEIKVAREEVSSTLFRLMEKVLDGEQCWEWRGSLNNYGYGAFWHKNKYDYAPRVSYEVFLGEIPEGKFVLHNCDNPLCVNPHHLFIGTHQDNMADMVAKGRSRRGEVNRFSKLKTEQVIEILRLYKNGFTNKTALGKRFSVAHTTINKIVAGKSWKNINRGAI